jgi:signal transduction histidine kinase
MKELSRIILLFLVPVMSDAQQNFSDSLRKIFLTANNDSILYRAAIQLYDHYEESNRDTAFYYADQSVIISRRNNKKINEAYSLNRKAYQEANLGKYAESLHSLLEAFTISENIKNDGLYWMIDPLESATNKRLYALSTTHHIYGILMRETQDTGQQIIHFGEARRIAIEINNPGRMLLGSLNLGRLYLETGDLDSAMQFENEAEEIVRSSGRRKYLSTIYYYKALINLNTGDTASALNYLYECIQTGQDQQNIDGLVRGYHQLAEYYLNKKDKDSSYYYANKSLHEMKNMGSNSAIEYNIGLAYESLYEVYKLRSQFDSSFKYLELAHRTIDSISQRRIKNLAAFQKLTLDEQQRLQNAEKEKITYRNKVRTSLMLAGIGVLLLLAIIFYRNNQQKNKAKLKIEKAYDELKATQQQLIQSEKMASLGELTAGIAHEIQNPLNFVNNFSDVNKELLVELKDEIKKGNLDEVNSIADDVISNEEKISHHGKRADAIVKGMLQHSRSSTGVKEPTDINALCDEYLRLAYHGLRAKDKSFNATMKTDFDESIGNINIVPQDIGRVILNLITNAFYAVTEKKKSGIEGYEPTVSVITKKRNGKVEISVKDNGNGIPDSIKDKIFQPFFTTKPTGSGTGLGLSLSYDIVKAHGGEIKVESKEGEGTRFDISLMANHSV